MQCGAQLGDEAESLHGVLVASVVIHGDRAAGALGVVQSDVSTLEQQVLVAAVARRQRNADAAADGKLRVGDGEGDVERGPHPRCCLHRRSRVAGMEGKNGELVTAEARDEIAFADRAAQPSRHLDEQQVTDVVTQCVVDLFEVVEVEEHHRERPLVEVGAGLTQAREEQRAVRQPGKGVVERFVLAF